MTVEYTYPAELMKDFEEAIESAVREKFKSLGVVHGDIYIEPVDTVNGTEPALSILFAGEADRAFGKRITVLCDEGVKDYIRLLSDGDISDKDAAIDEFMIEAADAVCDTYRRNHVQILRHQKDELEIESRMDSVDESSAFIYPDIWFKEPACPHMHDAGSDIWEVLLVASDSNYMCHALTDDHAKAPEIFGDLMARAKINANNEFPKHLRLRDMMREMVEASMSPFAFNEEIDDLVDEMKETYKDDMHGKLWALTLKGLPVPTSSVLLSRSAMLIAAKTIGARKKIIAMPTSKLILAVYNADESDAVPYSGELYDELYKTPEILNGPVLSKEPIIYDVLTGGIAVMKHGTI